MRRYARPVDSRAHTTDSNIARSCFDTFGTDESPKKAAIDDAMISASTSVGQVKVQVLTFLCRTHTVGRACGS